MALLENFVSDSRLSSSTALWHGDLTLAHDFTFGGHLEGSLKVNGQLTIVVGSQLDGTIQSHSLRIEPGAKIRAQVKVKRLAPLKREFFKIRLF